MELNRIVEIMEKEGIKREAPVMFLKKHLTSPFRILVFVMLSSRTRDETTAEVTRRLFRVADTPEKIARMDVAEIEKLIYGVGFYRIKARKLKELASAVAKIGRVPETFEELIKLPGIGRKSAKVVLAHAFGKPAIGVDTHVHRISNRLGLVRTSTPEETDRELARIVPDHLKPRFNRAFVAFGQVVCKPRKPLCEECPLLEICPRIGVST